MLLLGCDVSVYIATVNQSNVQMDMSVFAQESVFSKWTPAFKLYVYSELYVLSKRSVGLQHTVECESLPCYAEIGC